MNVQSICAERGCGRLYQKADSRVHRCREHQAAVELRENARRNSHPRRQVYDDPSWSTTRQIVKGRDGYRCVDCGRGPLDLDENEMLLVDHITPVIELIEQGGNPFDADECETRCSTCSGAKDGQRGGTR